VRCATICAAGRRLEPSCDDCLLLQRDDRRRGASCRADDDAPYRELSMSVFVAEFGAVAVPAPSEKSWMISSISESRLSSVLPHTSRVCRTDLTVVWSPRAAVFTQAPPKATCPTLDGDLKSFSRGMLAEYGLAVVGDRTVRPPMIDPSPTVLPENAATKSQ